MDEADRRALEDVYEHWSAGDWTPRFAFYDEHFEWGWSDEFPDELAGVYEDLRTPNPRLRAWITSWELWRCSAEDYVPVGDSVVVLARYRGRGRGSGIEVDQEGAHVWELRAGRAVRLEIFGDRELAFASVGGAAGAAEQAGMPRERSQ